MLEHLLQNDNLEALNHRFFFDELTKVDQVCHENAIARRAREIAESLSFPNIDAIFPSRHRSRW